MKQCSSEHLKLRNIKSLLVTYYMAGKTVEWALGSIAWVQGWALPPAVDLPMLQFPHGTIILRTYFKELIQ